MYLKFSEKDLQLAKDELENNIEPCTFNAAAEQIANECVGLMISKQKDYGKDNILDFGEYGVLVRMNDKFQRLKNLNKSGKEPNNESIEDTLKDIANYAIISLMLRRGQFELPMEG